jgi:hypothetical protein
MKNDNDKNLLFRKKTIAKCPLCVKDKETTTHLEHPPRFLCRIDNQNLFLSIIICLLPFIPFLTANIS